MCLVAGWGLIKPIHGGKNIGRNLSIALTKKLEPIAVLTRQLGTIRGGSRERRALAAVLQSAGQIIMVSLDSGFQLRKGFPVELALEAWWIRIRYCLWVGQSVVRVVIPEKTEIPSSLEGRASRLLREE